MPERGRGGVEPNVHITPDKKWVVSQGNSGALRSTSMPWKSREQNARTERTASTQSRKAAESRINTKPRRLRFDCAISATGLLRKPRNRSRDQDTMKYVTEVFIVSSSSSSLRGWQPVHDYFDGLTLVPDQESLFVFWPFIFKC
jgi:hypothetical protein